MKEFTVVWNVQVTRIARVPDDQADNLEWYYLESPELKAGLARKVKQKFDADDVVISNPRVFIRDLEVTESE